MAATAAVAVELFTSEAVVAAATSAVAGTVAGKLLNPKAIAPEIKAPTVMPDPLEQEKAKQKSIIEQMSRRGRQASILTSPGSGGATLGGG